MNSSAMPWKPGDATKLAAFHRQYAAPLQHDAPADASDDAVTYGYIRSHMRHHQRITTLITLCPGNDYLEGTPCDSEADAAERADGMGITLVETGVLEDMVEARRAAQITTLRQYMEQDAQDKRAAEAVPHEAPALDGIRKGDLVRVQTSNPRVPFVGRVEKLTWDGRVCVKQGDITYWTRMDRVTVLATAEARDMQTAAVS